MAEDKNKSLAPIEDKAMLEMFKSDANLGLEDVELSGNLMPKLVLLNSQSDLIKERAADITGKKLETGNFYHSQLKKQYEVLKVNILYIREAKLPSYTDKNKLQLNYIVAGVMVEDNAPFILYIKGMSLNPFWKFQKELAEITTHPTYPVPMPALYVEIKRELRESKDFGKVDAIILKVVKDNRGMPEVEGVKERYEWLKTGVAKSREAVERMLNKSDDEEVYEANVPAERVAEEVSQVEDVSEEVDVNGKPPF